MRIHFNHFQGNIHPIYQHFLSHPPKGVEFVNVDDFGKNYQNTAISGTHSVLEGFVSDIASKLKNLLPIPNVTLRKFDVDLIFSCGSIPLFGRFILDIECYEALNRFSPNISENPINKAICKHFLSSDRCLAITCHSEAAATSLRSYLGDALNRKINILHPAIDESRITTEGKAENHFDVLFIGRYFKRKGGDIALEVAKRVTESNPHVRFTFVTQLEGTDVSGLDPKKIRFLPLIPRSEVLELFKHAHAYFMPTFFDTFGYVFLEAFAYRCVPISLDDFAIKEIIDDGKDGIIIPGYSTKYFNPENKKKIERFSSDIECLMRTYSPEETERIVRDATQKISLLASDRRLWEKISDAGYAKIESGKFSSREKIRRFETILSKF